MAGLKGAAEADVAAFTTAATGACAATVVGGATAVASFGAAPFAVAEILVTAPAGLYMSNATG